MPKLNKKISISIFITCFISACTGGSGNQAAGNTATSSLAATPSIADSNNKPASQINQKIIAFAKNNRLYQYELYVGNNKKPALVVHYTRSALPKDIKQYSYSSLKEFIAARSSLDSRFKKQTKSATLDVQGNSQSWLAVGYLPSTQNMLQGSGNNACYYTGANGNSITADTTKLSTTSSFAVTSASSGDQKILANTTNVSASYLGFKAHANITYSNDFAYNTSYNNYTLAAAVGTVVDTGIPSTNNLSPDGLALLKQSPETFIQNCGTAGIQAYIGGIVTTLNLGVGITNQSTAESFAADIGAGYSTYIQVDNAFDYLNTTSNQTSNVSFTYNVYGDVDFSTPPSGSDAQDYTTYIANAISANKSYLDACSSHPADVTACKTYNDNMATTIMSGVLYAQSAIKANPQAAASTLYPFPNGIDLANEENQQNNQTYKNPNVSNDPNNPYISYVPASNESKVAIQDPYVISAGYMQNAYSTAFQLNALAGRAAVLSVLPDVNTQAMTNFLSNLSNRYSLDSQQIVASASECYQSIATTGLDKECNSQPDFYVAQNEGNGIAVNLTNIPNNVYQLYSMNDQSASDDLPNLLLQNSIALQYSTNYIEVGTGISNNNKYNNGGMIRAANQIGFGVAYYNNALNDSEFFGGSEYAPIPSNREGYVFINTKVPVLGNIDNNIYSNRSYTGNSNGTVGSLWWQPYTKDTSAIQNLVTYPAAPLYFAINYRNLIPFDEPVAAQPLRHNAQAIASNLNCNDPSNPFPPASCALFNKIVGSGTATYDSSSMQQNNSQILLNMTNTVNMPNVTQLAEGLPLPAIEYSFNGSASSGNGLTETCLGGVYLPPIDTGHNLVNMSQLKGYGQPDSANGYLCADPNPSQSIIYLGLNQPNNGYSSVAQIQQNATLSLTPNKYFFGVK